MHSYIFSVSAEKEPMFDSPFMPATQWFHRAGAQHILEETPLEGIEAYMWLL